MSSQCDRSRLVAMRQRLLPERRRGMAVPGGAAQRTAPGAAAAAFSAAEHCRGGRCCRRSHADATAVAGNINGGRTGEDGAWARPHRRPISRATPASGCGVACVVVAPAAAHRRSTLRSSRAGCGGGEGGWAATAAAPPRTAAAAHYLCGWRQRLSAPSAGRGRGGGDRVGRKIVYTDGACLFFFFSSMTMK